MDHIKNVTLIIVITTLMAFGLIGVTLLIDLLPIPAMHAPTTTTAAANAIDQVALKSGFAN
ncbi:hypothetical protein [Nitrososphaera viennensis]|uniref:Uncharacterized protein n=2 Tax=Nitrososphaera viennensis TaxID=1034015 RepID=A0A060HG80_9ARCH|nr:hypothetical protein [Nitrososphaera viennensis]AIC15639.1 hypothetical protein NVIE_013990 [Nitrososphaera viennensis EN76]UVS70514.1 hypothetical protein NWT39_06945 [Nitrososphaera viennensis]